MARYESGEITGYYDESERWNQLGDSGAWEIHERGEIHPGSPPGIDDLEMSETISASYINEQGEVIHFAFHGGLDDDFTLDDAIDEDSEEYGEDAA